MTQRNEMNTSFLSLAENESFARVVIAAFAMGGISSLLTFLNINSNFQTMVYGLVLVFAMVAKMIVRSVRKGGKA